MNALEQVVRTIYQQREIYLREHAISPQDLVVRVSVNHRLRQELLYCQDSYHYMGVKTHENPETLIGGPFEATRDIPDGVYYLDLMVYNRVQKQLKFTLQPDSDVSS